MNIMTRIKLYLVCFLCSLSRYKLKFSPDKVDTMIVQAICKYACTNSRITIVYQEFTTYSHKSSAWQHSRLLICCNFLSQVTLGLTNYIIKIMLLNHYHHCNFVWFRKEFLHFKIIYFLRVELSQKTKKMLTKYLNNEHKKWQTFYFIILRQWTIIKF